MFYQQIVSFFCRSIARQENTFVKNHYRMSDPTYLFHRFLDEAGDTTFYKRGKVDIVGTPGVSKVFCLGCVKFKEPLLVVRQRIRGLIQQVETDTYFSEIPSIQKRIADGGFFFHATDDVPEVRKILYDFISTLECSFEVVVARKIPSVFENKHNGRQREFYADLLAHLLKNKLHKEGRLVLNIAQRADSTKHSNLNLALTKAIARSQKNTGHFAKTRVVFDVQPYIKEPLLCITDYFCWAVQRVFERGEIRYYNFLKDRISLVLDLYDTVNWQGSGNYYTPKRPLTTANHL